MVYANKKPHLGVNYVEFHYTCDFDRFTCHCKLDHVFYHPDLVQPRFKFTKF